MFLLLVGLGILRMVGTRNLQACAATPFAAPPRRRTSRRSTSFSPPRRCFAARWSSSHTKVARRALSGGAAARWLGDGSLTKKAYLNALTEALDYGARLAVGFLITPLLVAGLGATSTGCGRSSAD